MPPALAPLITSTTSCRWNALQSAAYTRRSGTSSSTVSGPRWARRAQSISTAQPPIHTARLTPPLSAIATRTSSTSRTGSGAAACSLIAP